KKLKFLRRKACSSLGDSFSQRLEGLHKITKSLQEGASCSNARSWEARRRFCPERYWKSSSTSISGSVREAFFRAFISPEVLVTWAKFSPSSRKHRSRSSRKFSCQGTQEAL